MSLAKQQLPRRRFLQTAGAAALASAAPSCDRGESFSHVSQWAGSRIWVGPAYWANPLQNWSVLDGEVQAEAGPGRTLHLLTHQVADGDGELQIRVTVRPVEGGTGETWAGFVAGVRGELPGYQHALVHPETGVSAGIREDGRAFIGDAVSPSALDLSGGATLTWTARPREGGGYQSQLIAEPLGGGEAVSVLDHRHDPGVLAGNLALAAQSPGRPTAETSGAIWGFRDWQVGGGAVQERPEQAFGPILWTQYTLSRGVLKLTALFPPIGPEDSQICALEVERDGAWTPVAEAAIEPLSRTAIFRQEDWSDFGAYRIAYQWQGETHYWEGRVRPEPAADQPLSVAVFSCDHGECFPQERMVRQATAQDPDVVFFAGDQIYESHGGFGVARERPAEEAIIDYFRKYWQHGWTWREILKDRPSIVIPDDHDVFQGNIWGQGGRPLPPTPGDEGMGYRQAMGGYLMEVDWVNAVQRTQAGHLPDPVDPQPCESGIEVYFTEMRYGGVSFAILEDRKFKTGPNDILSDRQRAAGQDRPEVVDVSGAEMLGERQEAFLREWVQSSQDASFRLVCSQTILCKATTHAGRDLNRMVVDLDCGGWPQTARNRALTILQPAADAIMLHGDQHTGILLRHGVEDWEDSALAFMVPGTSNGFPRAWWPESDQLTGRFLDGLGNRMTVLGAANPERGSNTREGQAGLNPEEVAHSKGSGYGAVTLDPQAKSARFDLWRHQEDEQFDGFPITVEL